MCTNKPLVLVDRDPWYPWTLQRLGLEYRHEKFRMRNKVERSFRYLKERTVIFHHKLSVRDHNTGDHEPQAIPKPILLSICKKCLNNPEVFCLS
jgi:hypothetical protein